MTPTPIPFLDLVATHRELEEELVAVCREAIRSAWFIGGPQVEGFEREFAEYCGTEHCVGVGSGTDAVRFALMAAGVGPGDAVVTVSHTFIATVEAIGQAGAATEFVDIDERTYNLSPEALAEYLAACETDPTTGRPKGRRTGKPIKAVVPVHLYGQPADMDAIQALADRYNLVIIEDAAQAHGAEYLQSAGSGKSTAAGPAAASGSQPTEGVHPQASTFNPQPSTPSGGWRRTGGFGVAAAFSFSPGKNLGACGEAGAVTTNDGEMAKRIRMLRDHGQARKYYHDLEGYNGRLDAIQAGMLRIKLRHLDNWNAQRRAAAARYNALLTPNSLLPTPNSCSPPYAPPGTRAGYHLYVIRVSEREGRMAHLKERGIATALHYPVPVHLQDCYRAWGYGPGDLPATERVAAEIVSLPMFPGLTEEQQARVAAGIEEFQVARASRP